MKDKEAAVAMARAQRHMPLELSNYRLLRLLGRGIGGRVYLADNIKDHSQPRAIKVVEMSEITPGRCSERHHLEVEMMNVLHHENVASGKTFESSNGQLKYMVMQYYRRGDLLQILAKVKRFRDDAAPVLLRDLVVGLLYLHGEGYAHRDIKPENIFMTQDKRLVLGDYGLSCRLGQENCEPVGSLNYAAPELLQQKDYDGRKTDVWSLGVVLFGMLCGYLPFFRVTQRETFDHIVNSPLVLPRTLFPRARNLLSRMLRKDPARRISLRETLQHPFVASTVPLAPIAVSPSLKVERQREALPSPLRKQLTLDLPGDTPSVPSTSSLSEEEVRALDDDTKAVAEEEARMSSRSSVKGGDYNSFVSTVEAAVGREPSEVGPFLLASVGQLEVDVRRVQRSVSNVRMRQSTAEPSHIDLDEDMFSSEEYSDESDDDESLAPITAAGVAATAAVARRKASAPMPMTDAIGVAKAKKRRSISSKESPRDKTSEAVGASKKDKKASKKASKSKLRKEKKREKKLKAQLRKQEAEAKRSGKRPYKRKASLGVDLTRIREIINVEQLDSSDSTRTSSDPASSTRVRGDSLRGSRDQIGIVTTDAAGVDAAPLSMEEVATGRSGRKSHRNPARRSDHRSQRDSSAGNSGGVTSSESRSRSRSRNRKMGDLSLSPRQANKALSVEDDSNPGRRSGSPVRSLMVRMRSFFRQSRDDATSSSGSTNRDSATSPSPEGSPGGGRERSVSIDLTALGVPNLDKLPQLPE